MKPSMPTWIQTPPASWGEFPTLLRCGIVWASTWWGPWSLEDRRRVAIGPAMGTEGVFDFLEREELRWLVNGLQVAFPGMTQDSALDISSLYLNISKHTAVKIFHDNRETWRTRKQLLAKTNDPSAVGIYDSFHGEPVLPRRYQWDPLPLWPATDFGRVIDLGICQVQRLWINRGNTRFSAFEMLPHRISRCTRPTPISAIERLDWSEWANWLKKRYSALAWVSSENPLQTIPNESCEVVFEVGHAEPDVELLFKLHQVFHTTGKPSPQLIGREHLFSDCVFCLKKGNDPKPCKA